MATEIHIKKGNTKNIPVVYIVNGVQTDMNGLRIIFTIKDNLLKDDDDATLQIDATISTPNTMSYTFTITPAQTLALRCGTYKADIKIFKAGIQLSTSVFPVIVDNTVTQTII